MTSLERTLIGTLGGFAAVCVKFLGQDYYYVVNQAANIPKEKVVSLVFAYLILTPILAFLGGLLAWVSDETNRLKILAIGIAAPALITTWAGGNKPDSNSVATFLNMSTAYAQQAGVDNDEKKSLTNQITDGVKTFFGFGKEAKHYWVIVGSFKDREKAEEKAREINNEIPDLNAFVGLQIPPNPFYPVIVGGSSPLSEAKELKIRALKLKSVKEVYLSPAN